MECNTQMLLCYSTVLLHSTRAQEFRQFYSACILITLYHLEDFSQILASYKDRNVFCHPGLPLFFPCFRFLPNLGSDIEISKGFSEHGSQAIDKTAVYFVEMDGILARTPRAEILPGNIIIHRQNDQEALSCTSL